MDRNLHILSLNLHNPIPPLEEIKAFPRGQVTKLLFEDSLANQRYALGEKIKKELPEFEVYLHEDIPEIILIKHITDEEIAAHQLFFEQCAKDYRELAKQLIVQLADKFRIKINEEMPLLSFNRFKSKTHQGGEVGEWEYFLHGYHCWFEHKKTQQTIEVPLVFGLEFGDLDPYFFMSFITSTPAYQPLPVTIMNKYADGVRVNNKMLSLGKFERICSNYSDHFGIAVTDRDKVEIKIYTPPEEKKPKFNLWKFLGLK